MLDACFASRRDKHVTGPCVSIMLVDRLMHVDRISFSYHHIPRALPHPHPSFRPHSASSPVIVSHGALLCPSSVLRNFLSSPRFQIEGPASSAARLNPAGLSSHVSSPASRPLKPAGFPTQDAHSAEDARLQASAVVRDSDPSRRRPFPPISQAFKLLHAVSSTLALKPLPPIPSDACTDHRSRHRAHALERHCGEMSVCGALSPPPFLLPVGALDTVASLRRVFHSRPVPMECSSS